MDNAKITIFASYEQNKIETKCNQVIVVEIIVMKLVNPMYPYDYKHILIQTQSNHVRTESECLHLDMCSSQQVSYT